MEKYKGLSGVMCAISIQTRTGKVKFLTIFYTRLKRAEINRCSCYENPKQTAEHVLATCPKYSLMKHDIFWRDSGIVIH